MTLRNAVRKAKAETGLRRDMKFAPTTLDTEARTVEVIAATETPVDRVFGREILVCDATAVMPRRLHLLPVLDSHRGETILNILGTVVGHRFEGRKLIMKLRFADTPAGNTAMALVADGTLTSVSIGYRILKAEEVVGRRDDVPTVRITRWEPLEVSFVSVPADPTALVRGKTHMAIRPKNTNRNAPRVIDDLNPDDDIDARLGDDVDDDDVGATAVRRQTSPSTHDMATVLELRSVYVRGGGNDENFKRLVQHSGGNIQRLRDGILDSIVERERETPTDSRFGFDERRSDNLHDKIIDYFCVRVGGEPTVRDNELYGTSLHGTARRYMEARGFSTRNMDDQTVLRLAFNEQTRAGITTSDYPQLFVEGMNRFLEQQLVAAQSPMKSYSRKRNARDFRPQKGIIPGESPELKQILENGAIPHGSFEVEDNILTLAEYGVQVRWSRVAMINDDLGAIADMIGGFGQSAANKEAEKFVSLLTDNNLAGKMLSDGKPLFHVSRNNLAAAGTGITVDAVSEARQVMRTQKSVNGNGITGVVPTILLVGPKQETAAEKFVASLNATTIGEANPFSGRLRVEVENRLPGRGWYLLGDPAQRPVFQHAYLDGAEGPHVDSEQGWDTLGMKYRCVFDFGCGVRDWRAIYYNPGEPEE